MQTRLGVIDLFAGPGGLGEGFASISSRGHYPFEIAVSVEKEVSAHRTLRLRSFIREYLRRHGALPSQYIDFHANPTVEPDWTTMDLKAWDRANQEALRLELGSSGATEQLDASIRHIKRHFDDAILIGGPPCQAYSLVGRARSRGKPDYVPEKDERHFLFREYIRVLDRLRPAAFVMENVKGMLSSTVDSRLVFEMLMEDLSSLTRRKGHLYEMRAIRVEDGTARLVEPDSASDFIVRSEEFGVPQRRHRVIIIGVRSGLASQFSGSRIKVSGDSPTVQDAIGTLAPLRSGLSKGTDSPEAWLDVVSGAATRLARAYRGRSAEGLAARFLDVSRAITSSRLLPRSSSRVPRRYGQHGNDLMKWIERPMLRSISLHETRGHMVSDLSRYLFAAVFAQANDRSPKATDFPQILVPDHKNWHTGIFADRFRVQLSGEPSTTVTSHISKDGHYFIHPDPHQCRSLTVREAARLQTFPDDYMFLGNRTQQYVQVGNAVPPYLARQIAHLLLRGVGGSGSSDPSM